MKNWFLTDGNKKRFCEVIDSTHNTRLQLNTYQRIYELLCNKECQIESMSHSPFDEKNYLILKEDLKNLKGIVLRLLTHPFTLLDSQLQDIYMQVKQSLRCKNMTTWNLFQSYFDDQEPYYLFIQDFKGFSDILEYSLSHGLNAKEYTYLVHSYQVYLNELMRVKLISMNEEYEDVARSRQNAFDVLYHKCLTEVDFMKYLELASSYDDASLSFAEERCKQLLRSHPSKESCVPLGKTLTLSLDARINKSLYKKGR